MLNMEKILERMDLQHLREFLLYGIELSHSERDAYQVRLAKADQKFYAAIRERFPAWESWSFIEEHMNEVLTAHDDIYTEVGMYIAFQLIKRLSDAGI